MNRRKRGEVDSVKHEEINKSTTEAVSWAGKKKIGKKG